VVRFERGELMNKREQTDYKKVIGKNKDGEIVVLDYIFEHTDGLKGATGSTFRAVSKEEREERVNDESYLEESWKCAVQNGSTELGLSEWCELVRDTDGDEAFFDLSYSELWDDIREAFPEYADEDAYTLFECAGGGRCFPQEWDVLLEPELNKKILEVEKHD